MVVLANGGNTLQVAGAIISVVVGTLAVIYSSRVLGSNFELRLTSEKERVSDELEAKLPAEIPHAPEEARKPDEVPASLISLGHVESGATVVIAQNPLTSDRRFSLQKDYYSETLAQARVSFRLSAVAAALGFILVIVAVVISLFVQTEGLLSDARTTLPVVGSLVAELVAALFVSQWRAAQSAMGTFFEGFIRDRRLDESLTLSYQITDEKVRSATQSSLAMAMLDLEPGRVEHLIDGLRSLAGAPSNETRLATGRVDTEVGPAEDGAGGAARRPGQAPA